MKSNKYLIVLIAIFGIVMVSCKKENLEVPIEGKKEIDQSKVYRIPETEKEKSLVKNLENVTTLFKELYKNNSNIKVVNAAIFSKIYTDESVLLKELIYPSTSRLNKSEKFKKYTSEWGISLENFSNQFWKEAEKLNNPDFNQFLKELNSIKLNSSNIQSNSINSNSEYGNNNGEQVTIYFPYSDNFSPDNGGAYYAPITSIVTATADADEGWGNLPYYLNGIFQYYMTVIVNDDFAYTNPSHIIGLNGVEPYNIITNAAPPPPVAPPGVNRVYVGDGICKVQYDRLISFTGNGGGSEIKYCRLSGYLQPVNGQVTSFQDIISADFSRTEIRNQNWKLLSAIWDDDWVNTDLEQVFAIYEEDNTNSKTFNGSLATTITVPSTPTIPGGNSTGTIGYTVTIQSQDDIIRELKISRNSYFLGAFQNQGLGFSGNFSFLPPPPTTGWPFYDATTGIGANVGWTWPYNIY